MRISDWSSDVCSSDLGGVDPVLWPPRAVADAGALRHLPAAGREGPPPRAAPLLRLVQPWLRQGIARLLLLRPPHRPPRRPPYGDLPRAAGRPRSGTVGRTSGRERVCQLGYNSG